LAFVGGHPDNEGAEPLSETPNEGPRFPYASIRHKIKDYAPPVPRCYDGEQDEQAEDDEDEDEQDKADNGLRSYARAKQGREMSPWVLPSARTRGDIIAEYRAMGCTMEG
jgi:hypothetical protein